ncbi:conserved hypothetical protein [Mesorhizobium metallidurans STM 2683]|uniref:Uncharacterized protein n=1 Tax=Mesorhizobium metallidurans STM 2683 TaxID=1297569 RepID=M5FAX9_9HYPH|nr:hypothetical protein [Mesorhizobium metallidurans]CCV09086.1 conserved hypothetical protein [Mesorhizobium metallidurans STM 2683]
MNEVDPDDDAADLFSTPSDVALLQLLLADLHDDLAGRLGRYHYLIDHGRTLGSGGTLLFGGTVAHTALIEARSSFVHGNFAATILLCQSLAENTLAGFLHVAGEDLPPKVGFHETLKRCSAMRFLSSGEITDLKRLADLRNPLSHFRNVNDPASLVRRSVVVGELAEDVLAQDAHFAIATTIRLMSKAPFRVG